MRDETLWILDDGALDRWLVARAGDTVALDLEADSFHRYRERVCLLQVSAGGRDALVDPLAGVDLGRLAPLLADPGVTKVLHGADYDLRLLDRDHGLRIAGLYDTMVAARLAGERRFGLAALLEANFGVRLDKTHQRADWARRPLPEAMEAYALEDTRHLARLREALDDRLGRLGRRAWAQEEFRRLEDIRWSGDPDRENAFLRIKGVRRIGRRGMTVARALHAWRDRRARARDVPAFRIAPDAALLAIARAAPADLESLRRIPGVPRPLVREPLASEFLAAVREGLEAPAIELPRDEPESGRAAGVDEARVRRLRDARDAVAARLDLEPALLGPRRVLEAIAVRMDRGQAWEDLEEVREWQRPWLEESIRAVWGRAPGL